MMSCLFPFAIIPRCHAVRPPGHARVCGSDPTITASMRVPTPGKVAIDGKLSDWDLSGQILQCYDIEALQDVYSGRIAMMYDTDNLYVAIHWKDPIPMGNSHDPHYQAGKGWAGDAIQMRIKTDRVCHVTAWYYAAGKEPFAAIDYGKSPHRALRRRQQATFSHR